MRAWLPLFVAVLGAILTPRGAAQDIEIEAFLVDDQPYVGSPVGFVIAITGTHSAVAHDLPNIPLVETQFDTVKRNTNFHFENVNGRLEQQLRLEQLLLYDVVAHAPGRHTIPPVEVTIGGEIYRTKPVEFLARVPRVSEDTAFTMSTDRTRVFVGEPVRIRLTWYTDTIRNASINGPMGGNRADLYAPARPRWAIEDGADSVTIKFLNRDLRAGISRNAVLNGAVYDRKVTLDIIMIPTEAGELDLGPMVVEYRRLSRRDFQAPLAVERASSNRLSLDVLEVPVGDAPPSYTGVVGVTSVTARTDAGEVKVGDPIELTLEVLTDEPAGRVRPPALDTQGEAWAAFQLDPMGWEEIDASATTRTYRTVVRAKDDGVDEIPPIELAFFDPRTERFALGASRPIPLSVEATRTISSVSAIGSLPAGPLADSEPLTLRDLHAGVLDNATGARLLVDESASVLAFFRSPVGIGAIALPPAAYFGTALFLAIRRRTHSAGHRRKRALARARRALSASGPESQRVRDAIRIYVGERFDRDAQTITPKDCRDLLDGKPDDDAPDLHEGIGAQIGSLLLQAERDRFDEIADPSPPPVDRARELLRQAEGERA